MCVYGCKKQKVGDTKKTSKKGKIKDRCIYEINEKQTQEKKKKKKNGMA